MAKNINAILFDNFDIDFDYYKSSFQECRNKTDEEMECVSDNEIWKFINEELELKWSDFKTNLRYSKNNCQYCVIVGVIETWRGHYDIQPVVCNSILDAILKCCGSADSIIVKQRNGHIHVTAIHHDGANEFEIRLLNNRGVTSMERINQGYGNADLSNRTYHRAIKGWLF